MKAATSGHERFFRLLLAAVATLFIAGNSTAAETTAVISLKAQHYENDHWEPWNPGISFEFRERLNGPLDASLSLGGIRDSLGNWSPHAGIGMHKTVGKWSLGLNATLLYRQENLDGNRIGLRFAPLPSLDYNVNERFGWGMIFIPAPTSQEQDSGAMLLQLRLLL